MPIVQVSLPGPGPMIVKTPVDQTAPTVTVDLPPQPTVVDTAVMQAANN